MSANLAWVLALVLGPAMASAQCYEDTHCFYTCGYGYYQHAGLAHSALLEPSWATEAARFPVVFPFRARRTRGLACGGTYRTCSGGYGQRAHVPRWGSCGKASRAPSGSAPITVETASGHIYF